MFIKKKLLQTQLFVENEYFDLYVQLIQNNQTTRKQKCRTQKHHIIPSIAFKLYNWDGEDASDNFVNLLYKDHVLAHYYLALCSKESEFKYKMICSINFILGKAVQVKLNVEDLKNFTLNLDQYQQLYEESKRFFGDKIKGTTHSTSESTKQKISLANKGKVYVYKDGIVRSIYPNELNLFLNAGWEQGNPNASKRDTCKGRKIIHKEDQEKYCKLEDLDYYISLGWELGHSKKHCESVKEGTNTFYSTLTPEEKRKKCATYGMLGKHLSEESKLKHSLATKGRKRSEEQKLKNSINKKGTIHMTNGTVDVMIKPEREEEFSQKGFWRGRSKNRKENK